MQGTLAAGKTTITKGIAKTSVPTDEEVLQALKTTDYGLCVYHANNAGRKVSRLAKAVNGMN